MRLGISFLIAVLLCGSGSVFSAVVETKSISGKEKACNEIADEIEKALRDLNLAAEKKIAVQSFIKFDGYPAGDLKNLLIEAFKRKGFSVANGSRLFIKGTITNKGSAGTIDVELFTRDEGRKHTFKKFVDDPDFAQGDSFDVASSIASNASSAATAPKAPNEVISAAVNQEPRVVLTDGGTIVRPKSDSKFGLGFTVTKDGQRTRLPLRMVDGMALVELKAEQEFGLFVVNDTTADVGVSVAVDGVNIFVDSTVPEYKKLGKIWISPSGGNIAGWYIDNHSSRRFKFGSYQQSVAAEQGVTEEVGGVSVLFYEKKSSPPSVKPPAPEMQSRAKYAYSGPRGAVPENGIGKGSVEIDPNYTTETGEFGNLFAAVTVRYQKSDHPVDLPTSK